MYGSSLNKQKSKHQQQTNKAKQNYHTFGSVKKGNRSIVKQNGGKFDTSNTDIHDRKHYWLGEAPLSDTSDPFGIFKVF